MINVLFFFFFKKGDVILFNIVSISHYMDSGLYFQNLTIHDKKKLCSLFY